METLSTYTFKDLIASDRKIIIPSYQRAYAWGEKQITDFIQDLIDIKSRAYYFGHFILEENGSEKTFEIIDGQQRITTFVLFLLSAKQFLKYRIDEELLHFIKKRFHTIDYDRERFSQLVDDILADSPNLGLTPKDDDTASFKRILDAISIFRQAFEKKEINPIQFVETLSAAQISIHIAYSKSVAVQIFELQNSRGISLDLMEKVNG